MNFIFFLCLQFFISAANAQAPSGDDDTHVDLDVGGDIFSDFSDDLASTKQMQDENFWNYGRFFDFAVSAGTTSFTGNRGVVTQNEPPMLGLMVSYYMNLRVSYQLGVEFSRHNMVFDVETDGFTGPPGLVQTNFLRPYFGIRYHLDTSDLGLALTYSHPYLTGRFEYWYQKNKFPENLARTTQSGGGVGFALGGGLEFPIVLREYYIGIEALYHMVSLFDEDTSDFIATNERDARSGIDDLNGDALSFKLSYIISW